MGRVTVTLPRLGETMEEARVTDWLVAPGVAFARGDVLLEVETDKTVVEVPALTAGLMVAHLVSPGDTVALDQPIAEVEVEGATAAPASTARPEGTGAGATGAGATGARATGARATGAGVPGSVRAETMTGQAHAALRASPAARAAARRMGVDLIGVHGTGRRGRIQAADVAGGRGNAATLVLLHGLFDDAKGWRDLPRRMERAGHAVIAPDLPGHGDNTSLGDLDTAADHLASRLPAGPLRLIGHSLGAVLAVRLALRLGTRVERLVLLAPVGLGPRINADFTDGMLAAETPAALARALGLLGAGPISASGLALELSRVMARRAGHAALAATALRGGFQQIDITADLARMVCPVTVIFGTEDRVLDWRDVANLPPQAAIHLVKGAGHLPHLAAPDVFLRLATDTQDPARRIAHA